MRLLLSAMQLVVLVGKSDLQNVRAIRPIRPISTIFAWNSQGNARLTSHLARQQHGKDILQGHPAIEIFRDEA